MEFSIIIFSVLDMNGLQFPLWFLFHGHQVDNCYRPQDQTLKITEDILNLNI